MKKLLITAYSLELGGIEKALVNMIKFLKSEYKITLVLEKKQGIFLNDIPKEIEIIEYKVSKDKNVFIRKLKNYINFKKFYLKHKNKYDASISYTTYSVPGSKLARSVCKNNILWIHGNYAMVYEQSKEEMNTFYNSIKVSKFKKLVFVSNNSLNDQRKIFPNLFKENKSFVCNNFVDYKSIIKESNEKIKDEGFLKFIGNNKKENENKDKDKDTKIIINVARHSEKAKKITRIIKATKKLKDEKYIFKVILVGDGPDTKIYKDMINQYKLNEYIYFAGMQKNPYPYFKYADASILSSKFEGYPVVFLESMVLNIPIITTKVSEYKEIDPDYGISVENSENGVYEGIKYFLENNIKIKKFNPEEFNLKIKDKIINIIEME